MRPKFNLSKTQPTYIYFLHGVDMPHEGMQIRQALFYKHEQLNNELKCNVHYWYMRLSTYVFGEEACVYYLHTAKNKQTP